MASEVNPKVGSLIMSGMGLVFTLVGSLLVYFAVDGYLFYQSSLNWPQSDANLLELNFKQDETGTIVDELSLKYSYTVNDKTYEGSAVYHGGPSLTWNDQEMIYEELSKQKGTIKIYVNPQDPEDSFIKQQFPEESLMFGSGGGIFATFGVAILLFGLSMFYREYKRDALKAEYPDESWRWFPEWHTGVVKAQRKKTMIFFIFGLVIWFQFVLILFIAARDDLRSVSLISIVCYGAITLWVFFLFMFARSVIRQIKYGTSTVKLDPAPGIIGGKLIAEIQAPAYLRPQTDIYIRLQCSILKEVGTVGDRRSKSETLWEADQHVSPRDGNFKKSALIPIEFDLADNLPEANGTTTTWSLEAFCKTEGMDWQETFWIPVFQNNAPDN